MRLEVVVNARFLSRRTSGVERYGREISSCLGDRCRLVTTRSNGLRGHLWEQLILPHKLKSESVLWSPANTGPLSVRRQALTVHDLSPLENRDWFRPEFAAWYRLFLPILVRRVPIVFTPSEYVRSKLIRKFGLRNVIVTPNGVDTSVFRPDARQDRYRLPLCYILFVGTLEPRKNLAGLLQAWREINREFPDMWLVIAGANGAVHRSVALPTDAARTVLLGHVEESALPGLYAGATMFVLPSLEEGFGLPVLEAMACGTPVLVSNGGALPEVTGDAGVMFDLAQPDSLPAELRRYLQDAELRASMREGGLERVQDFSWKNTAELIWNSLHEI